MGLMRLPLELLRKIATYVDDMAPLEAEDIRQKRGTRLSYNNTYWGQGEIMFWSFHEFSPILNSIQSLGVVNRTLYHICSPLLWKKLIFPTALPIPLEFFTETILPKHGRHVRSLIVTVSTLFTFSPSKQLRCDMSNLENLIFYYANEEKNEEMTEEELQCLSHRMMCSPATLMDTLDQCRKLRALDLSLSFGQGWDGYEDYYETDDGNDEDESQGGEEDHKHDFEGDFQEYDTSDYDISDPKDEQDVETYEDDPEYDAEACKQEATQYANGVNAFMVSLIEPLSKLKKLRHLGVRSQKRGCSERGVAQLIAKLPRLTSFAGEAIGYQVERKIRHRKSQTLGWQLSRLEHLTKLELVYIFPKDTTWFDNSWRSKLITLTLNGCEKAHKFIHIFASSLVELKLKSCPSKERMMYRLPHLSELYLRETAGTALYDFVECPNLRRIDCGYYDDYPPSTLQMPFIIQNWRSLQQLRFIEDSCSGYVRAELAEWREICDGAGIVFVFDPLAWDSFFATIPY